jgi:DNA replicative helicase MCM subunit Mcm2 (Cdc46/Mcm family)
MAVSGVVTRTSEVRPELLEGTFKCLDCGTIIRDVQQQFKYTQVWRSHLLMHLAPFPSACNYPLSVMLDTLSAT